MQLDTPEPVAVPTGRAARAGTVARGLTAASVLVSAAVHLDLWLAGMRDVDVIGPLFLLNAVGGLVVAMAVLLWRHWLPLLGAVGFGVATFGAYLLSMTVGLFGVQEQVWTVPAVVSAVSEVAAVVCAVAAWVAERRRA